MKLEGNLSINGQTYTKGTYISWYKIYPFFLVHMLMFGGSGFLMAYASEGPPLLFLYAHGGFAIVIYTVFYLSIFGRDQVKWMFINAGLGLLGIYTQIGWLLSLFGKEVGDYPIYKHVIPFLYFVLYTFLIRQAVLDLMKAREDDMRKKRVEYAYVAMSVAIYVVSFLFGKA
jgi:drug/metabolite transporter (DMT)-like permease